MKTSLLTGMTRKGCFQKEVSGFLEALQFLRDRWNKGEYIVFCFFYQDKKLSNQIFMDDYICPPRPLVFIDDPLSFDDIDDDELPF